jgi:hypothetical protein
MKINWSEWRNKKAYCRAIQEDINGEELED